MGRDRSLDEFFGGGNADDAESDSESGADRAEGDSEGGDEANSGDDDGVTGADANTNAGTGTDRVANDDGDGDGDADALPDASAVDPATPTCRWTPEGSACESCGSVVERRWADDGAFVCDDCKAW